MVVMVHCIAYHGWKLWFLLDQSDFDFMHTKHQFSDESEPDVTDIADSESYKQHVLSKRKVRKELYV